MNFNDFSGKPYKARESLWCLYQMLEVLRVVNEKYSSTVGPTPVSVDTEFVKKFLVIEEEV
jgi:hypothetical protein